ncbi:MAG TPA: helix-turn-helix domain-containing protein [Candidatus Limnocylindria bacterium]|jgi:hypothetical protein
MARLIDVWRVVDPEARLAAGDPGDALALVRGISRTRAAPPHLPPPAEGHLLVVDAALLAVLSPERLLAEVAASGSTPVGILLAAPAGEPGEWPPESPPILVSRRSAASLAADGSAYLADEAGVLGRLATELRLAAAEAALGDPVPAAPAGLVADRIRRGVAVVADGELVALHPRPAGRALAARFAAAFSRLFGPPSARAAASRRLKDGMWVHEVRIRANAAVWLFDDLPLARADEVAAESLAITLRALLRRPARATPVAPAPVPARRQGSPAARSALDETLLAVARANGRVSPAARSLGVHRNTVLYRLKVARDRRGIDPRRAEDALRLLREDDRAG